jgi:hypothetical protein
MRQVPEAAGAPANHLLIGNGKLSRHFEKYFAELGLRFETWKTPRDLTAELFRRFRFTHVWYLVSDDAIAEVHARLREGLIEFGTLDENTVFLHTSGASVIPGVVGAHPLMTFGPMLYDAETYRRIPFIIENRFDGSIPGSVLGGIPNLAVYLDPDKRALYHSLVSVAGNFPALLWAEVFTRFESELGLSRDLLAPYLFRTLANVISAGEVALTGPLVRGDAPTIRRHRSALAGTPLSPIYGAFEEFFKTRGIDHV